MKRLLIYLLSALMLLVVLHQCSHYNFLLFHMIAEIFSIIIACGIFMVAWNCRRYLDNQYLLFIGIAYLFIGILDLTHAFSYKGMNLLPDYGANAPTQLWIAARYLQSITLLAAPLMLWRRVRPGHLFTGYGVVVFLLIMSIFSWRIFPDCYVDSAGGLTLFKKTSEVVICILLAAAGVLLFRIRGRFNHNVFHWLMASILLTIFSEIFFTAYKDVTEFPNILGHHLKIVAFYCIYKAIIETGLTRPFEMLFRDLASSKEHYQSLFLHMTNGFAHHRVVTDAGGKPVDYLFLEVNEAFGKLTGLRDVVGRHVTEVIPGIENDPANWIGIFGKVAITRKSARFDSYSEDLKRWYSVNAYSPADGEFVAIFEDITERKEAQQVLQAANEDLENKVRERTAALVETVNTLKDEIVLRKQAESALKRTNRELADRAHQLRELARELTMVEQRERRRMSRILHDGLQQDLAAAKLQLNMARSGIEDDQLKETLGSIENIIGESIQRSRTLSTDLSPPVLHQEGLSGGLEWLVRLMKRRYDFHVDLFIESDARAPDDVVVLVFESVRELLFNSVKHSGVSSARVVLESMIGAKIRIAVSDEGLGFDTERITATGDDTTGYGLFSIRKRIKLIEGNFDIKSAPGRGSRFTIEVPLSK